MNDMRVMGRMAWIRKHYPLVWDELSLLEQELSQEEREDLEKIYACLDCHDLPSVTPRQILTYVQASRKARRIIPYVNSIPREIYDGYVLQPRVNNEWLDCSRGWLLDELYPRVKDKDILSAALEVNYWCSEHASYTPTDERTIAPFGMCRRAQGRCGEESTLLVSSLRSVGIPARQCYAPYWAHCDDNHAWVEFWANGDWHYMGACEPEWQPDIGWFQSAASKALLIRSRVPDPSVPAGYRIVNTTSRYADTVQLSVLVTDGDLPVSGAEVRFQLINYSSVQTLYSAVTGPDGNVTLEAGIGSIIVSTCIEGILIEKLVDLRKEQTVVLRKGDGFSPITTERVDHWTLIPPKEIIPSPAPKNPAHDEKLHRCAALRNAYISGFYNGTSPWMKKACGNQNEVRKFLELPQYELTDKELLLQTLTDKDYCDCTSDVLESFLRAALPYKERYSLSVWQNQILAPRVEWEMLLPVRPEISHLLSDQHFISKQEVLNWMEQNLTADEEYGLTDRRGNAAAYIRNRHCPKSEWELVAVQICRAFGIPAVISAKAGNIGSPQDDSVFSLTLRTDEILMNEEEHFSLSRWNGQEYVSVNLNGCRIQGSAKRYLKPGAYRLVTVRRQIDGSINARIHSFLLQHNREIWLMLEKDETKNKLQSVPLPDIALTGLTENAVQIASRAESASSLLIFLQPGNEPTEHLLQELLSLADMICYHNYPIRFLVSNKEDLQNDTLQLVLKDIPSCAAFFYHDEHRFAIQSAAGIGDGRLPLALALDSEQRILYGFANYNIRTGNILLNILSMSSE